MKRRITDPKSPWFPLGIAFLLAAGMILWPRTAYRRWRGPRLMSRKESLSERARRLGHYDDVYEGGTETPRNAA